MYFPWTFLFVLVFILVQHLILFIILFLGVLDQRLALGYNKQISQQENQFFLFHILNTGREGIRTVKLLYNPSYAIKFTWLLSINWAVIVHESSAFPYFAWRSLKKKHKTGRMFFFHL